MEVHPVGVVPRQEVMPGVVWGRLALTVRTKQAKTGGSIVQAEFLKGIHLFRRDAGIERNIMLVYIGYSLFRRAEEG